jgi:subtilisin family serine protease
MVISLAGIGMATDYSSNALLVRFRSMNMEQRGVKLLRENLLKSQNVHIRKYYDFCDTYVVRIAPTDTVDQAMERLRQLEDVEVVEPNYRRFVNYQPNDPMLSSQYMHEIIQSEKAWDLTTGSKTIKIGVIDSGIDSTHPDLRNNLWMNPGEDYANGAPGYNGIDDDQDGYVDNYFGINAVDGSGDTKDDYGHGSHVAGIIGAVGNNGIGVAGVNLSVTLVALKIINDEGYGTVADELEAIDYARKIPVQIANMSYGGYDYSEIEKSAIDAAKNILFVASAGNERNNNDGKASYPASYSLPNMISVAATDSQDNIATFSNYGVKSVHLAAPGVHIYSTVPNNAYAYYSGTSMSAPVVTGVAGLILAKTPSLSAAQVKNRILRNTDPVSGLKDKVLTGGRVNAFRSLSVVADGPYIYRIDPARGPVNTPISIYGAGFGGQAGKVFFNGNIEAPITSWSDELIAAAVPDGATTGPVTVVIDSGTSNAIEFTVSDKPINMTLSFAHLVRSEGLNPIVVVANPQNFAIDVQLKFIGNDCGTITYKYVSLNPYEKRILQNGIYDPECTQYSLISSSKDMFGAVVLMRESFDPDSPMVVVPHVIGGSFE